MSEESERLRALVALAKSKESLARWEREAANPATEFRPKYIEHQLQFARGRIRDLEAVLGPEEIKLRKDQALADEQAARDRAATNAAGQHPWRATRTLKIGDRMFARGSVVPDDVVDGCTNSAHLIAHGWLMRAPEPVARIVRPVAKPAAPAPVAAPADGVPEAITTARNALRTAAAARGCSLRDAVDVIDSGVLQRAYKCIADLPREANARTMLNGYARVRSGVGSLSVRRIIDDAADILCAEDAAVALGIKPAQPQQEASHADVR